MLYEGRGAAGAVWQTLAAPLIWLPSCSRVLMLGLGGGAVARAIRGFAPEAEIVGVEIDADVIAAARRHLRLDDLRVEVVHAAAEDFLRRSRRRYDAIIEDVFVGPSRTVGKPPWLLEWGYAMAWKRLRPHGILVSNTIHETRDVAGVFRRLPGRCVAIDVEGYWNTVLACGPGMPTAAALEARLRRRAPAALRLDLLSLRTLSGQSSGSP
jgi:spermidine synthase